MFYFFSKINQFILTAISVTFLYLGMRKRGGNAAVQMGLQAVVHGSHLRHQFPGQAFCPSALARLLLLLPLLPKVAVTGRRPAEEACPCPSLQRPLCGGRALYSQAGVTQPGAGVAGAWLAAQEARGGPAAEHPVPCTSCLWRRGFQS